LYEADLYLGKSADTADYQKQYVLSGTVVINLIQNAGVPKQSKHCIFMDNYFSSQKLLTYLSENKIGAVGKRSGSIIKCGECSQYYYIL
jgi:hypothetical protein